MRRIILWLRNFYLDNFVDLHNAWIKDMRRQALDSVSNLLASTDAADTHRLQWIHSHKAKFDWVNGCECCCLRCQSYQNENIEGWGDDARQAVDSAMQDERELSI